MKTPPIRLPRFKLRLPKLGKRGRRQIERAIPVLTDIALKAAAEQPQPGQKKVKRDALWWVKLALLAGLAIAPQLVEGYPDQTWDDALLVAVTAAAAALGVKHAAGK